MYILYMAIFIILGYGLNNYKNTFVNVFISSIKIKFFKLLNKLINKENIFRIFVEKNLLAYSRYNFNELIFYQINIFLITLMCICLVKYTNIQNNINKVYTDFEYGFAQHYANANNIDKVIIFKQEIDIFKNALKIVKESNTPVKESVEMVINQFNEIYGLNQPKSILTNKVIRRIDVINDQKYNFSTLIIISFLASFSIYIFFIFSFNIRKIDKKKELRFLKKIIILEGSLTPVNFINVLYSLLENANFYKKILQSIINANQKNSQDIEEQYRIIIKNADSIKEKLFLEKLEQANISDFSLAIKNTKNEFLLEKLEYENYINKRKTIIDIYGMIAVMLVLLMVTATILDVWTVNFSLSKYTNF